MTEVTIEGLNEDLNKLTDQVTKLLNQINNIWSRLSDLENWASGFRPEENEGDDE
jgi:hypothetical protein